MNAPLDLVDIFRVVERRFYTARLQVEKPDDAPSFIVQQTPLRVIPRGEARRRCAVCGELRSTRRSVDAGEHRFACAGCAQRAEQLIPPTLARFAFWWVYCGLPHYEFARLFKPYGYGQYRKQNYWKQFENTRVTTHGVDEARIVVRPDRPPQWQEPPRPPAPGQCIVYGCPYRTATDQSAYCCEGHWAGRHHSDEYPHVLYIADVAYDQH